MVLKCVNKLKRGQTIVGNDVKDFIVKLVFFISSRLEEEGVDSKDINTMLNAIQYTISAQTQETLKNNLGESRKKIDMMIRK